MCEKQIKTVIITILLLVLLKAGCLDRCSGHLRALSLHFYVFIVYLFIYFCECVVFFYAQAPVDTSTVMILSLYAIKKTFLKHKHENPKLSQTKK